MTDASQLAQLRDRIEKASGGDREIDVDLAVVLFDVPDEAALPYPIAKIERSKTWSNYTIDVFPVWSLRATISFEPPNYTTSVDAALALVEKVLPDSFWELDQGYNAMITTENPVECFAGTAATPALALLSALLSSKLSAMEARDGE